MSFPLANKTKAINKKNPAIWANSINLSLGLRPLIISYNKNITCPPSSAGIGKIFIKAKIIDISAVVYQKLVQSQVSGNRPPMAPKPPTCEAPFLVNTYLNCVT